MKNKTKETKIYRNIIERGKIG